MIFEIFISYLLFISLLTFILFGTDKRKARQHHRRIPEKQLLLCACIGGSPGALAGMYFFRHKTRRLKFTLGIPLLLLVQILIIGCGKPIFSLLLPIGQ